MKSFPRALIEMVYMVLFMQPFPLNLWLYALITPSFAYLYFGNSSVVAQTVFVVSNSQAIVMALIYQRFGFVKLMGLAHFTWMPLVYWIYTRHWSIAEDTESLEYKWMAYLMVVLSISVALDIKDVIEFVFLGKREVLMTFEGEVPKKSA